MEKGQFFLRDKRLPFIAAAGFLLGRVWFGSIDPFGIALFADMCAEKRGYKITALAVLAGMMTASDGIGLLKYIMLFSMILSILYVQEKMGRGRITPLFLSVLCGGLNFLLGIVASVFSANTWESFWLSLLEGFAVFALANVFRLGVRFILYEDWKKWLGDEEMISLLALVFTALYGIPRLAESIFSVTSTISCLLVLVLGFRFGAAAGAAAGTAAGILAVLSGKNMVLIGCYCLIGVCVGMFRRMGRVGSAVSFFLMGCLMMYGAGSAVDGIIELRAMMSAVIIFLAIPGRFLYMAERDRQKDPENLFTREDIRELANSRIEDFSAAFRRLSRSFEGEREPRQEVEPEELERIFDELSEKMCRDCVNCKFCWERHFEETSVNFHNILLQLGQGGSASVTADFGRRCIRLEECMDYAREKMAVAQMNLGWKNRLAESRDVIARQMLEVASALKSFTLDLDEVGRVPEETRRAMGEELKKRGVLLKKISAKYRKGKLEVAFAGRCKGNQCLTKTDLAEALSEATGVRMKPDRDTRNVLAGNEETMFFRQDTVFRSLTGLARMAKSGEEVSGDNYSFLELQTGELLMVLADGMGSGERADKESKGLIEALENMLEAGLEKRSAIRMLNTLLVAGYEGKTFTALDMASVDLYTGVCEIIKNGAAPTFIKRGESVETVTAEALPVGIVVEEEGEVRRTKLKGGDMIVMVSDGVIDGYCGEDGDRREEALEKLIAGLSCQNPTDMANQILMHALARSDREAADDMSVLVAGIWDKV